jgi:hypothetical protein
MSHQIPHQQSKAPNKQITFLYSPLQKEPEEGAVDAISLLLICIAFFFGFLKLLLVAKQEGVHLRIEIKRQELVGNS